MSSWFWITTVIFMFISVSMILIILVQRPQGGGLAGAFGGAGGTGADTVFGGRVGDALTWATVVAFAVYLGLAITLNLMDNSDAEPDLPTAGLTAPLPDLGDTSGGAPAGSTGNPPTTPTSPASPGSTP